MIAQPEPGSEPTAGVVTGSRKNLVAGVWFASLALTSVVTGVALRRSETLTPMLAGLAAVVVLALLRGSAHGRVARGGGPGFEWAFTQAVWGTAVVIHTLEIAAAVTDPEGGGGLVVLGLPVFNVVLGLPVLGVVLFCLLLGSVAAYRNRERRRRRRRRRVRPAPT